MASEAIPWGSRASSALANRRGTPAIESTGRYAESMSLAYLGPCGPQTGSAERGKHVLHDGLELRPVVSHRGHHQQLGSGLAKLAQAIEHLFHRACDGHLGWDAAPIDRAKPGVHLARRPVDGHVHALGHRERSRIAALGFQIRPQPGRLFWERA